MEESGIIFFFLLPKRCESVSEVPKNAAPVGIFWCYLKSIKYRLEEVLESVFCDGELLSG